MAYLEHIRKFVPPLSPQLHKGQAGKIGVLGGSKEYTGAPYYAAYSALKLGADISHIFCSETAGTPIKSYSPELIVHPILKNEKELGPNISKQDKDQTMNEILETMKVWLKNIHVLIVGPGLGRDTFTQTCTTQIINHAKQNKLPLVIDGDGLFMLSKDPSIIKGYPLVVLTPNVNEFRYLCESLELDPKKDGSLQSLCKSLGNVTIVRKGQTDVISNGDFTIECKEEGSLRRSGGQGDVLSGSIGLFFAWANMYGNQGGKVEGCDIPSIVLAGYAGCLTTRLAGRAAFKKHKRSSTTPNIIEEVGAVFEDLFPSESNQSSKL